MDDTYVDVPDELGSRLAQGHTRRGRPRSPFEHPALVGAGSLRSTTKDMLRLLRAHVDPPAGRLGIAIELAQRPRGRLGRKAETGLGWMIASPGRPPVQMHWHNGGTGGFRSFAAFVCEQRTAVVVLANTNRSVDLLGLRLLKALGARRD
jgi:CubicO group peptidase (beta-lactamase class C family)